MGPVAGPDLEAIVLAGGLGTRLRSAVPDLPKPLAPVAGRPFLAIVLDALAEQGIATAILSVGYRHERIRDAFGDAYRGIALRYAVESEPLGTGGAIRLAARLCASSDALIVNGDSYVAVDYAAMHEAHLASGAGLSICVVEVADTSRYGSVVVEGDSVVRFLERGAAAPGWINAGVYVMKQDLLERRQLPNAFSFERDVLAAHVAELRPHAYRTRGMFIDIGMPEDYAKAQTLFASA